MRLLLDPLVVESEFVVGREFLLALRHYETVVHDGLDDDGQPFAFLQGFCHAELLFLVFLVGVFGVEFGGFLLFFFVAFVALGLLVHALLFLRDAQEEAVEFVGLAGSLVLAQRRVVGHGLEFEVARRGVVVDLLGELERAVVISAHEHEVVLFGSAYFGEEHNLFVA